MPKLAPGLSLWALNNYLEEDGDRELIDVLCKYGKSDRINYSIKKYYIKVKLKK